MSKQTNGLACYEFWDLSMPVVPLHSRLYSLEPLGLRTPFVESLTSYMSRLAVAHSITLSTLIIKELKPRLKRERVDTDPRKLSLFYKSSAHSLNGITTLSRDFVQTLESLTLRTDLNSLTLLPWSTTLASRKLIRHVRAWCPECFIEWQAVGNPLYEPLLWCVSPVDLCPTHERPLISQCPYEDCGAVMGALARFSRPGYCSKCLRWLGVINAKENLSNSPWETEEQQWQVWAANAIGSLLAHNIDIATPDLSNVPHVIAAYIKQEANGSLLQAETKLLLHWLTINKWKKNMCKPQLGALIRLCYCSGISLHEMVTLPPENLNLRQLKTRSLPQGLHKYTKESKRVSFDAVHNRQALEAILMGEEQPPPSMLMVAKRLNKDIDLLRRHYPDLCKAISNKRAIFLQRFRDHRKQMHKIAIRQAIIEISALGQYPDSDKVKSLLSKDLPQDYAIHTKYWRDAMRDLESEGIQFKKRP